MSEEKKMNKSLLNKIPETGIDPIMKIMADFRECTEKNKINLTVGAYRDENLQPYVFNVVRKVEQDILNEEKERGYINFTGDKEFCDETRRLFFSDEHELVKNNQVVSFQSFSGTGCIRLCTEFLGNYLMQTNKKPKVYIPKPTWSNHDLIFEYSNFEIISYDIFCEKTLNILEDNLLNIVKNCEENSVLIFHTCAYNPTGRDISKNTWNKIAEILKQKKVFSIMDTAYQGFASGDLDEDAYAIHCFAKAGLEFAISQSFSKNMGLYGERAGGLHFIIKDKKDKEANKKLCTKIKYFIEKTALSLSLCPIGYGSEIIKRVLKNYKQEWINELKKAVNRIINCRQLLYDELKKLNIDWKHIIEQRGMFAYTGLTFQQCEYLINVRKVFLVRSGRICVCWLNEKNVGLVAEAISDAIQKA